MGNTFGERLAIGGVAAACLDRAGTRSVDAGSIRTNVRGIDERGAAVVVHLSGEKSAIPRHPAGGRPVRGCLPRQRRARRSGRGRSDRRRKGDFRPAVDRLLHRGRELVDIRFETGAFRIADEPLREAVRLQQRASGRRELHVAGVDERIADRHHPL